MAAFVSTCVTLRNRGTVCTIRACAQREVDPVSSSSLGAPQVLCAGEGILNLISPPSPTTPDFFKAIPGGAATNVASTLCKLGVSSAFLGSIGRDHAGNEVVKTLNEVGVNVDGLQRVKERTRGVFIFLRDGEREFVGFDGKNREFADCQGVEVEQLPGVLFYAAKVLSVGTVGLAFYEDKLKELVQVGKQCLLMTVCDVNWRKVFWRGKEGARETILDFVKDLDLVKMSKEDVCFLFGEDFAKAAFENPELVVKELRGGCRNVVVTGGDQGVSYAFGDVQGKVAAVQPPKKVVDTTGAGDAFLGGFLAEMLRLGGSAALMDEGKCKQMVRFGTAVAACVVGGVGGIKALPTREEAEGLLVT